MAEEISTDTYLLRACWLRMVMIKSKRHLEFLKLTDGDTALDWMSKEQTWHYPKQIGRAHV